MNDFQIGPAATAPVSLEPRDFRSSNPIQETATMLGEYPAKRASVESSVVPVFPATAHDKSSANFAVPEWITPVRMSVRMYATVGSSAG